MLKSVQAEKRCMELEAMSHDLQTSLSSQDAELAEMQVRLEAAETHAAQRAVGQQKAQQEEERAAGKAMQATTRNVLLAQVCPYTCHRNSDFALIEALCICVNESS